MDQNSTVVGLDVHKDHITVAVLPPNSARGRAQASAIHDPAARDAVVNVSSTRRGRKAREIAGFN